MIINAEGISVFFLTRAGKVAASALFCLAANGCATVKSMTADFDRKWDDPKSILAQMDDTAAQSRASDSSAAQMAAFNANDCAKKAGLLDEKADEATLGARQISAGECLLATGKNEDAEKLFSLAADKEGGAIALQGRGVAMVRLGRYDESTEALNSALALDPSLWRAWNAFGVAAVNQGLSEEAQSAFVKAAELNPADGAALNNLGVSLLKADKRAEAIAAFKKALETDGAREAAEANLRLAYALDGDYATSVRALPDERRAIALNNAGVAAATRGDKTEARRLFARALDESPHFYAKAYNNLALLAE